MKITDKELKTRYRKDDKKTTMISIRITSKLSKWLKENELSPTAIFNKAIQELGYKNG